MTDPSSNTVLAHAKKFVGRNSEVERLIQHASAGSGGITMLVEPGAGASELLRQTYDTLFRTQRTVLPFYFEVRDETPVEFATRFAQEFITQAVAFRRNDPNILSFSPSLEELSRLAVPADSIWIDRLVEGLHSGADVRGCLSAPLRAVATGVKVFVMIDAAERLTKIGGGSLIGEIGEMYRSSGFSFVISGHRRALFAKLPFSAIRIERLPMEDVAAFIETLSRATNVSVNNASRDLIAVLLGGKLRHIESLFTAALEKGVAFDSFDKVEQVYTDEIFGGRIARGFETVFAMAIPEVRIREKLMNLLSRQGEFAVAVLEERLNIPSAAIEGLVNDLRHLELIDVNGGNVRLDPDDRVLNDVLHARAAGAWGTDRRGMAVGKALAANILAAPTLMARVYRENASLGLRDLMQGFAGQKVSRAAIDYGRFKNELKGAGDETALAIFSGDEDKLDLPRIVYTVHTTAIYPQLAELIDKSQSAIAIGFDPEGLEIAVIAVEVDSKLEATREVAEFWCDRLEMVATSSGFANYRIWLVAPEGFDEDALQTLAGRSAYGSSRQQVKLLISALDKPRALQNANDDVHEFVVPMGETGEMLSAKALDDISARHSIPPKTANQIKTALIEACINAAEHSLSPDQKIHERFSVEGNKLTITIVNRGLRLSDKRTISKGENESRRGWGLKLMQGLMDEVRVEDTDDGTRLVMTKTFKPLGVTE